MGTRTLLLSAFLLRQGLCSVLFLRLVHFHWILLLLLLLRTCLILLLVPFPVFLLHLCLKPIPHQPVLAPQIHSTALPKQQHATQQRECVPAEHRCRARIRELAQEVVEYVEEVVERVEDKSIALLRNYPLHEVGHACLDPGDDAVAGAGRLRGEQVMKL